MRTFFSNPMFETDRALMRDVHPHRVKMALVRKSSNVAAKQAAELGEIPWGDIFSKVIPSAIDYKVSDLKQRRAEANARLVAAQTKAAVDESIEQPTTEQPTQKTLSKQVKSFAPMIAVTAVMIGAGFYLWRRRRST